MRGKYNIRFGLGNFVEVDYISPGNMIFCFGHFKWYLSRCKATLLKAFGGFFRVLLLVFILCRIYHVLYFHFGA